MVVNNGCSNQMPNNSQQQQQLHHHQLPTVFTTPICTTTSAPSSAPVSPSSYSLNFLHSVGVQMAGGIAAATDPRHHMRHHIYSSSATVSPASSTQNMIIQGQRIIYQDIPPPPLGQEKQNNRKYSQKVQSPSYNNRSSDIPILINNNISHSSAVVAGGGGDNNFSSAYNNYPPLNNNNNFKHNTYIPLSFPYHQKSHNDLYSTATTQHTPTFNRNRNQSKAAWNTAGGGGGGGGGNINAYKNTPNSMTKDYNGNPQMNSNRVKNHQNINNLTYLTSDPKTRNMNSHTHSNSQANRSQSSSPKLDFPPIVSGNKATNKPEHRPTSLNMLTQVPAMGKVGGDSFSPGEETTHQRVASEGYESDSSNSSCDKRASSTGHSNHFLSSSSSSLSSTEIPYHHPPNITHNLLNFPTTFAEDDPPIPPPMQHFYGSEQNLSQWIPALHAQFMYSAHGILPPNGGLTSDFQQQQQQFKKSQTSRSSYRGGRDRYLGRSHVAEVREVPRQLLTRSKWDNLSQGIWNKFVNAQQTEDTFKKKMRLWRYLYIIVKNSYPRLGLYLVGSTMSGFGADTSDIDMCLVSKAFSTIDPRMEALFNLTLLKDCLVKTGEFEKFNLIEAKVPILRFKDRVHNLEVDLNFNNCVGIKNTHLLFCYSQLDWRLRPLVLVTKLWAQYHNINNAKNMTISSYSLVLMVIHFLQCAVSPPVLPCLHELYPDKFHFLHRTNDFGCVDMNETIAPFDSQNNQTLGQLFLEFLQYYSNFNYSQFAISIRTGALIPIEYCRQAKSIKNDIHQWKELCIEEPFDLTNTARSVYDSDTFERVKLVFVSSFKILQETLDINSIFSPLVPAGTVQEN